MAVVAGAAFWILSHGGVASSIAVPAYAELIDYSIAPLSAGRLATVKVRLGQRVKAGEVVATLDTRALELKREQAHAELAQAQATLRAEEAIQRAAVLRSELLVLRLRDTQGRGHAELAELDQQLARLSKLAEQQLVQVGGVEESRRRRAGIAASVALLDDASTRQIAALAPTARRGGMAAELELRLQPYREVVRIRDAAARTSELALEEAAIRTSVDGVVADIMRYPGEIIAAGSSLVRIATGRPGFIVCWLPERLAERATLDREVGVRAANFLSNSFPARIVAISPEIEEVPTRARTAPTLPAWGRRVILESRVDRPLLPGEALNVRL